jgi:magnesium transporter
MPKFIKRTSKKAGAAPGTLVHIGTKRTDRARITVIDYDAGSLSEKEVDAIEASFAFKDTSTCTWINVDGVHDVDLIQKMGDRFSIHPLTIEDIVNTGQRSKSEEFEAYVYFVLKMLHYDTGKEEIRSEQVSLILGPHYLISLQELEGDVFAPVRERIRKGKGRIRKRGCDYLAYALIDAVVDHYFLILEKIGEKIETLEEELLDDPGPETMQTIHEMKRELIYMRKQVWPMRELVNRIVKEEFGLVQESSTMFFNDVYDHAIQVIDTIDSYRDVLSGMLDLYLSTVSSRMNEVMKVLTIIATIFIPITFVAGIYGMNFKFMPELEWRWGYAMVWVIIAVVVVVMLGFFRRKKWI